MVITFIPAYGEAFPDFKDFESFQLPRSGPLALIVETNAVFIRHFGVPLCPLVRRKIFGFLTMKERCQITNEMRNRSRQQHQTWPLRSSFRPLNPNPKEIDQLKTSMLNTIDRWNADTLDNDKNDWY